MPPYSCRIRGALDPRAGVRRARDRPATSRPVRRPPTSPAPGSGLPVPDPDGSGCRRQSRERPGYRGHRGPDRRRRSRARRPLRCRCRLPRRCPGRAATTRARCAEAGRGVVHDQHPVGLLPAGHLPAGHRWGEGDRVPALDHVELRGLARAGVEPPRLRRAARERAEVYGHVPAARRVGHERGAVGRDRGLDALGPAAGFPDDVRRGLHAGPRLDQRADVLHLPGRGERHGLGPRAARPERRPAPVGEELPHRVVAVRVPGRPAEHGPVGVPAHVDGRGEAVVGAASSRGGPRRSVPRRRTAAPPRTSWPPAPRARRNAGNGRPGTCGTRSGRRPRTT